MQQNLDLLAPGTNCKYKESQTLWKKTLYGVFDDHCCNDLRYHYWNLNLAIFGSQVWISVFLLVHFRFNYCVTNHNLNKKNWKLLIDLDLNLCFCYEQFIVVKLNMLLCVFVVVVEAQKLEVFAFTNRTTSVHSLKAKWFTILSV